MLLRRNSEQKSDKKNENPAFCKQMFTFLHFFQIGTVFASYYFKNIVEE